MSDNVINTPVEEPVAEEPVLEESEPEPVAEEPVVEESEPEPEPVAEEPVAEEPVAEEPVAEEPVANVEVDRLTALENKVNNLVNILNNSYYQRLNNDDILEWKNNLLLVREDLARL